MLNFMLCFLVPSAKLLLIIESSPWSAAVELHASGIEDLLLYVVDDL